MADSAITLTIYSKPACVQCTGTLRHLETKKNTAGEKLAANKDFGYIDATQDEAAFDFIANTLGTRQMPVGVARGEDGKVLDWWTGFNPDKLDEWVGKAGLLEAEAVAA
jgi:glutaredoxin-like protein NrdH